MFKKSFILSVLSICSLFATDNHATILHSNQVDVHYKGKPIAISRNMDIRCRKVPFDGKTLWSHNYPKESVPAYCKKTFMTTVGMISPMKIYDDIETFGELEVLDFIEDAQEDDTMLFIDTRKPNWYHARTIATAVNIPFFYLTEKEKYPKKFEETLAHFNVQKKAGKYDFSQAKTLLLFCNATWCLQSTKMIEALNTLGYPHEKMKWYRGGLQAWLNVNLSTVTGN